MQVWYKPIFSSPASFLLLLGFFFFSSGEQAGLHTFEVINTVTHQYGTMIIGELDRNISFLRGKGHFRNKQRFCMSEVGVYTIIVVTKYLLWWSGLYLFCLCHIYVPFLFLDIDLDIKLMLSFYKSCTNK